MSLFLVVMVIGIVYLFALPGIFFAGAIYYWKYDQQRGNTYYSGFVLSVGGVSFMIYEWNLLTSGEISDVWFLSANGIFALVVTTILVSTVVTYIIKFLKSWDIEPIQ